jgi:hypothetical protein
MEKNVVIVCARNTKRISPLVSLRTQNKKKRCFLERRPALSEPERYLRLDDEVCAEQERAYHTTTIPKKK